MAKIHYCKVCDYVVVGGRGRTCVKCLTAEHNFEQELRSYELPENMIKKMVKNWRKQRKGKQP